MAAKRGGDGVAGNIAAVRNRLLHLCLIAGTRVSIGCSCHGSQVLEATLGRVSDGLLVAKSEIEQAQSILDGEGNDHHTSTDRIALALLAMPTLAQIGELARDVGYGDFVEHTTIPVVRYGPTWCRLCGISLGHPGSDQHAQRDSQEVRPPLSGLVAGPPIGSSIGNFGVTDGPPDAKASDTPFGSWRSVCVRRVHEFAQRKWRCYQHE